MLHKPQKLVKWRKGHWKCNWCEVMNTVRDLYKEPRDAREALMWPREGGGKGQATQ